MEKENILEQKKENPTVKEDYRLLDDAAGNR